MCKLPNTLIDYAYAIVATANLSEKTALAKRAAQLWHQRKLSLGLLSRSCKMPERPGRPEKPVLLPPKKMPKRSTTGARGRIALLHSLAHIELNAIDMTWDLIARFGWAPLPTQFFDNWVQVGVEEAKHFELLERRLTELGAAYGDLPAHDGLWQTAQETGEDILARVAIVPLVLEARGLDVTPSMIRKMEANNDQSTARILRIIYNDEKRHVAYGYKWFRYLCEREGRIPEPTFHTLVRTHFRGRIKPPFNDKARSEAGLTPGFYKPLSAIGNYV
ncbi:MAG: ferritin-like domain-containing protein [Pseudomonadota bacterium]